MPRGPELIKAKLHETYTLEDAWRPNLGAFKADGEK